MSTIQQAYNNYSEIVQAMTTMYCSKADDALNELRTLFVETLTEEDKIIFEDMDVMTQLEYIECNI